MNNQIEQLMDIAKRLDDMSEDGPSELLTLSEEIGRIADSLLNTPLPGPNREAEMPHWLRQMQQIIERGAMEIIAERYKHAVPPGASSMTINIPNPNFTSPNLALQQYARANMGTMNPKDAFKIMNTGV